MTETSSIVSLLGSGSGIDMAALATNLATAQFQPRVERLARRGETLERQISAASSLRNSISLLANALGDRIRAGDLAVRPGIADPAIAKVSSPSGSSGSGSYSLEVLSLAARQTLAGPAFASADGAAGSGALTLRFGAVAGTAFTEDLAKPPLTIAIPAGSTLRDVAGAINAAGAATGITAYVAQSADGARLVLKGAEGAASGFVVEAAETPGDEGLATLAWAPGTGDPARLLASARDASFRLDGLAMTSATNRTGTVAPGLALELTAVNAGVPTRISFGDPSATIGGAMQDLVSALNEVATGLASATDPMTGDLARDSGARLLKQRFSELAGLTIMPNAAAGAPRTLADLGLATERDGTFRLDETRLAATLERDPAGVAAMFTTGLHGIYATLDDIARSASRRGDPGSLAGSIARYQDQQTRVGKDNAELAGRQEDLRARLVSRFVSADSRIGASKATLSFLQAQIDAWNAAGD